MLRPVLLLLTLGSIDQKDGETTNRRRRKIKARKIRKWMERKNNMTVKKFLLQMNLLGRHRLHQVILLRHHLRHRQKKNHKNPNKMMKMILIITLVYFFLQISWLKQSKNLLRRKITRRRNTRRKTRKRNRKNTTDIIIVTIIVITIIKI